MTKKTELGKAMDVIQAFIGKKMLEAKKLKTQTGKSKFYQCLEEKGFSVDVNKYTNDVIKISYAPYARYCEAAYKKARKA